jgi:sarcosine/dimethylglycine N-methyltransferase
MNTISQHYSKEASFQTTHEILDSLIVRLKRGELAPVKLEELAALDQFHVGGLQANARLAERIADRLGSTNTILDAGCGLGGPARYLAARQGAKVTGVDLTDEFCQLAIKLNELSGIDVHIICADVLATGLASQSFDVVWTQHVAMNIANRAGLYGEFHRLLKDGGVLAIHDVVKTSDNAIEYPLPWSADCDHSHVLTKDDMFAVLEASGFELLHSDDVTAESLALLDRAIEQPSAPLKTGIEPALCTAGDVREALPNLGELLGRSFQEARINLRKHLAAGVLGLIQTTWEKA